LHRLHANGIEFGVVPAFKSSFAIICQRTVPPGGELKTSSRSDSQALSKDNVSRLNREEKVLEVTLIIISFLKYKRRLNIILVAFCSTVR